jgi:hypothetical protein
VCGKASRIEGTLRDRERHRTNGEAKVIINPEKFKKYYIVFIVEECETPCHPADED